MIERRSRRCLPPVGRVWLLAALAGSAGCTHVRSVSRDPGSLHTLQSRVGNRAATIVLADGSRYRVEGIQFAGDSARWQVSGQPGIRVAPTSQVAEIAVRSRVRGAADGVILAVLIGAPLGALLIDNPGGPASDLLNRAETALAGGVAFGVYGLPIGAIIGSRMRFRLQ